MDKQGGKVEYLSKKTPEERRIAKYGPIQKDDESNTKKLQKELAELQIEWDKTKDMILDEGLTNNVKARQKELRARMSAKSHQLNPILKRLGIFS